MRHQGRIEVPTVLQKGNAIPNRRRPVEMIHKRRQTGLPGFAGRIECRKIHLQTFLAELNRETTETPDT